MIAGATYTLPIDIQYPLGNVSKVIVTLKNETTQQKILKNYPNDNETYLMSDGRLGVRLSQQDTISLVGNVKVEAQINLASGAVAKTETKRVFVSPTLHTEIVDGAADNGENLLDGVTLELGAPITVVAEGSEGTSFQPGNALELKDGILNVLTTDDAEKGNNLPITSEGARKLADNISYNDLTDRPFYEETEVVNEPLNITWDGNTEGLLCVTLVGDSGLYKVSDLVMTDEQLKLCTIIPSNDTGIVNIGEKWDEALGTNIMAFDDCTIAYTIISVRAENANCNFGGIELTFPEKGIYFAFNPQFHTESLTSTEPIEQTKTVVHKLDKKFLPDDVATKADIIGAMEVGY